MRILFVFCLLISVVTCRRAQNHSQVLSIGTPLGEVDAQLKEASGLVASIHNPGFLWTINDSGNSAEVFLIDQHANIRLVCKLDHIKNRDWEDIASDTDSNGKSYLYIADIGDNFSQHDYKFIYRFEEPVLTAEKKKLITQCDTFILRMPMGRCDAETILIDPGTHDIFMIAKTQGSSNLYRAPNLLLKDTLTFEKVLTLPFSRIVAGSISADGKQVLLKNYEKIFYWKRSSDESLLQLLTTTPFELPYQREPQGEAIAWSRDATEFYTLGESTWAWRASLILHKVKYQIPPLEKNRVVKSLRD